jgi:hypothetical protein
MASLFVILMLLSVLGFIIGLVKPSIFNLKSRKHVSWIFGGGIVLFLILQTITSPQNQSTVATVPAIERTTNTQATTTPSTQTTSAVPSAPQATVEVSPAPAQQTNNQNTSPVSNETVSQTNAVAKAMDYLNYSAFSYEGLIAQLEYDQFSQADATYGADNSGANWNAEAAEKAKQYMNYSAFSRGGLIAQLEYDKFTQAQAEYGANAVGL